MHSIFLFTQSFCLLSLSSPPTLSKWSAAEFIICSGVLTDDLTFGANIAWQKICMWVSVYACMCGMVYVFPVCVYPCIPVFVRTRVLDFWSHGIFDQDIVSVRIEV